MSRAYNFSAGPATLPEDVLTQACDELLDYGQSGMSIMEVSHRGKEYSAVHTETMANIRELLNIGDDYAVLFMTGGASAQFALIPMNLRGADQSADYVNCGSWAAKAIKEAKTTGKVNVLVDTSAEKPARMPANDELTESEGAAYVHITSNETIQGIQWKDFPVTKAPLVADMSSDIMSRPLDVSRFGLIYAGAQKNLGPAGVTLVIMRKDLAERAAETVPLYFRYATHLEKDSLYNTPPCFNIYILLLVTRWLKARGGLEAMARANQAKTGKLYKVLDQSSFYTPVAQEACRSLMNVTFNLPTPELEAQFVKEAEAENLKGLKGHRSVGGIRASIYNAFPTEGVETLIAFMQAFETKNG